MKKPFHIRTFSKLTIYIVILLAILSCIENQQEKIIWKVRKRYQNGVLYKSFDLFTWKGINRINEGDTIKHPYVEWVNMNQEKDKLVMHTSPNKAKERNIIKKDSCYYEILANSEIPGISSEVHIFKREYIYYLHVYHEKNKGSTVKIRTIGIVSKQLEVGIEKFFVGEFNSCHITNFCDVDKIDCENKNIIDTFFKKKLNAKDFFWDVYYPTPFLNPKTGFFDNGYDTVF